MANAPKPPLQARLAAAAGSAVRGAIIAGGTALAIKGYVEPQTVTEVANTVGSATSGATLALTGFIWSVGRHFLNRIPFKFF